MNMTKSRKAIYNIVIVALMAALVWIGNYLQIKIPNGALVTRIHLGNSMCLLAGLLFGGMNGGLASGIGAGIFDLFDPTYIVSAPYTFISKFAMGFTAGKLKRTMKAKNEVTVTIISAIIGQIVYIVLYLIKSYFTVLIIGGTTQAAWAAVGTNAITSSVNAVVAVIIAVPLYFALKNALKRTAIYQFIKTEPVEDKPKTQPAIYVLSAFAIVVTVIFTINLSATKKVEKAQLEKEEAYQQQIDDLTAKVDENTKLIEELLAKN